MSLTLLPTVASDVVIAIAFFAEIATYRFAPPFLIPILWIPYFLRRRIALHPFHYALFAAAVIVHDLGAFGLYQRGVIGVSFDVWVHSYFGFVGTLILRRAFAE